MIFDETRDNLTRTENQIREADAHEETREDGPTWGECECEACTEFNEAEAEYIRNSRHIRYAADSVAGALFGQRHFGGK